MNGGGRKEKLTPSMGGKKKEEGEWNTAGVWGDPTTPGEKRYLPVSIKAFALPNRCLHCLTKSIILYQISDFTVSEFKQINFS